MSNSLLIVLRPPLFWWVMLAAPFLSLVYALYSQYGLHQEPCVLCIHIRIYIVAIMLAGLLGLILRRTIMQVAIYWLATGLSVGLALKCWELYGVEKGFIDSSCFIDAGLPAWFNLESWLPALFEVRGLCGQSPDVIFGWTMAQMLMPASIAAAIVVALATLLNTFQAIVAFRRKLSNKN